jgi:UDP-N-acetylmuramoyl-L-alanyl-D-glutamate--2,6-diaminopimelate ligase
LSVSATACSFRWHGHTVRVPLGGRFNAANALAAATTAHVLGIDDDVIVGGLARVAPVPGRFESVDVGQPFAVVVDYAHTPDGLAKVLSAARDAAGGGRVIVVFGCGGDRDAAKRPIMGRIAASGADVVVITSDNPRREDPAAIISAVRSGIPTDGPASVVSEPDRRAAIGIAVGQAVAGDVVVIAGKGHEPYQDVGDTRLPFDDRDVARQLLIETAR